MGNKETNSGGQTKFTIYDVMVTPLPNETGTAKEEQKGKGMKGAKAAAGNKNISELLTTTFDGFKYSDWVAEYMLTVSAFFSDQLFLQVQKMLSQGMSCIGLYIYCENEQVRRLA